MRQPLAVVRSDLAHLAEYDSVFARGSQDGRQYALLARLYARLGDASRAKEALQKLEAIPSAARNRLEHHRLIAYALIARAEARYTDAIRLLRSAEIMPCPACATVMIAEIFHQAGMPDSAAATFGRYLRSRSGGRPGNIVQNDGIWRPYALEYLGNYWYRAAGREAASSFYTPFRMLWGGSADPALQGRVRVARERASDG